MLVCSTSTAQKCNQQGCHSWIQSPNALVESRMIPGLAMAPMNMMAQIQSMRLGKSYQRINSPTTKVGNGESERQSTAEQRRGYSKHAGFGFCIRQIVNWAVAAMSLYPNKCIFTTKINFKSAYQQGHLLWLTALQACTQLLEDNLIITLHLTFGGAPCPYKWGIISETICDLANELIKSDKWDPLTLHTLVQHQIPPREYLPDDIPFWQSTQSNCPCPRQSSW